MNFFHGDIDMHHSLSVSYLIRHICTSLSKCGGSVQSRPHEIATGRRLNLKHIKAGFGDYIEASTDEIVTNDMNGRTHRKHFDVPA